MENPEDIDRNLAATGDKIRQLFFDPHSAAARDEILALVLRMVYLDGKIAAYRERLGATIEWLQTEKHV